MRDQSFDEALALSLPAPGATLIDRAEIAAGEAIEIDDAAFLFSARFERHGTDLLLTGPDGAEVVVVDYFAFAPADIVVPGGATLRAHTVAALAGPDRAGGPEHLVQVQAGGAAPIGVVEELEGAAQVQRTDGTVEDLRIGQKVFLGDVVFTGEGGLLSLTFVDGTVFTLNENARMTLDELVYAAGAEDGNSASFGLVEGSFVFIAGQVAGTGGMDIETPAATLGIRGTTGLIDVMTVDGVLTVEATLVEDPDGGLGRIVLTYPDGREIAVLEGTETSWRVTLDGQAQEVLRTDASRLADDALLNLATAAYFTALDRAASGETFVPLGGSTSGGDDGDEPGTTDFETGAGEPLGGLEEGGTTGGGGGRPPPDESGGGGTEREEDGGGSGGVIPPPVEPLLPRDIRFRLEEDGSLSGRLVASDEGLPEVRLVSGAENGVVVVSRDGSFTFVPDTDFAGTDSFVVQVGTGEGAVESRVTVDVAAVNDAPVAEDGEAALSEDGAASGRLVASDVDGDTLRFSLAEAPAHGALTLEADGRWRYVPDADYSGPDSFSWTVGDGRLSDGGVVQLTVSGTEDPIIVTGPASGAVVEGGTRVATGRLVASDADPEDLPLFEAGSLSGSVGRFTITADGAWRYGLDDRSEALSAGEGVTERFTVTARNADGESVERLVVLRVTGTDDAAVISGTFTGAVAEGDAEDIATVSGAIAVSDVDSGDAPSFAGAAGTGAFGTILVNAAGDTWTYTLDQAAVQDLGEGQTATDIVTLTDDAGNTREITVTVTGTDDAAVISGTFTGAVAEGDAEDIATVSGAIAVSDVDSGDAPSFAGAAGTGAFGTILVNAAGDTWTYTLDQAAVQDLGEGQTATDIVTLTDDAGNTREITVTVTGTDDAAVITGTFTGAATEGDAEDSATVSGAIAVSDVDSGDAPSFAGAAATGAFGTIVVNAAGDTWTYTLDQAAVQDLGEGQTATDIVTLTDDAGNTREITITVTGTDDAAVISGTFTGAVTEGDAEDSATVSGAIAVSDVDSGDAPSFAGAAATGAFGTILVNPAGDTWTYTLDQAAVQDLGEGQTATDIVTLTDDAGNTREITITVTGTDDAAVISGDVAGAVAEDGTRVAAGTLAVTDADADDAPVFDAATLTGTYGTLTLTAAGAWTYTLDNAAAQVLGDDETFIEDFTVTAGFEGESTEATVTVTVTGEGDAPAAPGIGLITSGDPVVGQIDVSDADAGDTASYSIVGDGPLYGSVALSAAEDGSFTYTPDAETGEFDRFEIRVTDSDGLSADVSVGVAFGSDRVTADNGQDLSIGIDASGSGASAAGSVNIFTTPPEVTTNNLVLVLDRSGSVGPTDWGILRSQMNEALTILNERFEDSLTPVQVSVVTYAANSTILSDGAGRTTFDLVDDFAALSSLVATAPYDGSTAGNTRFDLAFQSTETLLDVANAAGPQTNFVYFVTDGIPASGWEDDFANLINAPYTALSGSTFTPVAPVGTYDVIVEAFGVGGNINLPLLDSIDDNTATVVSGASDLADGFSGTALFSAELVEFSLRLVADGVDEGIVADESSPALNSAGTTYSLALAEISGLGDLLGDQNLFQAEATFDLDGDPLTTGPGEGLVTVRTAGVLGMAPEPVTLTGTARGDLLFGSAGDDTIDGGDGNDLILAGTGDDDLQGGAGDDVLIGGAGRDSVSGGLGDDRLVAGDGIAAGETYDGGGGRDVLELLMPADADADLLPSLTLSGIEVIDLENGADDRLLLGLDDVLEAADGPDAVLDALLTEQGADSMMIYGDANDVVDLSAGTGVQIEYAETVTDAEGDTFDVYEFRATSDGELLAALAVDTEVFVEGAVTS